MKTLSINLKNLLYTAKLSENELARRTGVSQQIINRILSGENQNPKIATLKPLANYFMVSISQLIGDDLSETETKLNPSHLGWQEIPLIDWIALSTLPLNELLLQSNRLLIDIEPSNDMFAVKAHDNSMDPKFSEGTLLIFKYDQKPAHGDFILLRLPSDEILVRQYYTKNNTAYRKCLNPKYKDYKLTIIDQGSSYLGTLVQSRTDYVIR